MKSKEECINSIEKIFNSWVIPEIEYQIEYCKVMIEGTRKENLGIGEYEDYLKTIEERKQELLTIKNIINYLKINL